MSTANTIQRVATMPVKRWAMSRGPAAASVTTARLSTASLSMSSRMMASSAASTSTAFAARTPQQHLSLRASFSSAAASPSILLVADHNNATLNSAVLPTLTACRRISPTAAITLLVAGHQATAVAESAAHLAGVTEVLVVDDLAYAKQLPENLAPLVRDIAQKRGFAYVVAPASSNGKNVIPRVAAAFDSQPITEVIEVKSADTFVRPIYAGNALATVQSGDAVKLLTVRPTAFEKAASGDKAAPIVTFKPESPADAGLSTWIKDELSVSSRPELSTARVVVSGGRGMKSGEHFAMLDTLADRLGGAVGASRAAVDAGFVPNEYQVGQTGKVVAPDLYIAVGISGAIQHLAGMKDSKVIVAVNKDAEAPIFQVADYGVVGDLFKIVPEMNEKLAKN